MTSVYEKVETIVLCYLRDGCTAGTFGTLTVLPGPSFFSVTADGRDFTVRHGRLGWSVRHGDYVGMDRDLLEAARLAVTP